MYFVTHLGYYSNRFLLYRKHHTIHTNLKVLRQRTMIINVLLLFFFILLIYYYYVYHGKSGQLINLIPGPKGIPIFGNVLSCQNSVGK